MKERKKGVRNIDKVVETEPKIDFLVSPGKLLYIF